ncbi:hypothetical protein FD724_01780 [Nostoc sp. C057]|uniref:hypothetical protein n=1 Tax=Nostoc sp. C057 TaxID=2576903 RepID=UPI0015C33A2E|nr:hypothetical protein [Nostoc sp. C057]QLE46996.1 hypothetical protein FD724_01780 [Nostoc sp. C057]
MLLKDSYTLDAFALPLTPLKKGGTGIKVPLFKGDLGGSRYVQLHIKLVLAKSIYSTVPKFQVLNAIERLIWRSLIEKSAKSYTQKPVVIEYVIEKLKQQVLIKLINTKLFLFNKYLLIAKAPKLVS